MIRIVDDHKEIKLLNPQRTRVRERGRERWKLHLRNKQSNLVGGVVVLFFTALFLSLFVFLFRFVPGRLNKVQRTNACTLRYNYLSRKAKSEHLWIQRLTHRLMMMMMMMNQL